VNGEGVALQAPTPRIAQPAHLTLLARAAGGRRFPQLVISELQLLLKGQRWWWYAGAAGILVGSVVSPLADSRGGWLVAAWIWPILLWSQLGAREARYQTQSLIFSSERALYRQLPAAWVAGVLVAAVTGGGAAIRMVLSADGKGLVSWAAGALFIPSLALALGVWSGSSKFFEALYTVWWYVGPAHHVSGLDFAGTTAGSSAPIVWIFSAGVLLMAAYVGRRMRLGYV